MKSKAVDHHFQLHYHVVQNCLIWSMMWKDEKMVQSVVLKLLSLISVDLKLEPVLYLKFVEKFEKLFAVDSTDSVLNRTWVSIH